MKKLLAVFALMLVCTSAHASGGLGGSAKGTCDMKSWSCNAYSICISKGAYNSPEYKACAAEYTTQCMASGTPSCDAKKYFPNLF